MEQFQDNMPVQDTGSRAIFNPSNLVESIMQDLDNKLQQLFEDLSGWRMKEMKVKKEFEDKDGNVNEATTQTIGWTKIHNHGIVRKENVLDLKKIVQSIVNPNTVFSNYSDHQISAMIRFKYEQIYNWVCDRRYMDIKDKEQVIADCMSLIVSTLNRAKDGRERSEIWGSVKFVESKQSLEDGRSKGSPGVLSNIKGLFGGDS